MGSPEIVTVLGVPLSVLDLAPVGAGSDARQALRASLDLVRPGRIDLGIGRAPGTLMWWWCPRSW